MKILINCSTLRVGGGLQVAHSVLYELQKKRQHKYVVVMTPELSDIIQQSDFPDNFAFIEYSKRISIFSRCQFLDKIVDNYNIEKVFTLFGPSYWVPKVIHICGFARPQYIYKNSPYFKNISLIRLMRIKFKGFFHLRSFRKADVLITENDDVSNKLRYLVNHKKIYTVTNYYNQIFDNCHLWDNSIILPYFDGFTILTIGANYSHKNLSIIPEIISYIKRYKPNFVFRFVLTIKKEDINMKLPIEVLNHICFLGKVNINQCPSLYEQSDIAFIPTLLECFSASYPEAMRMGIPILTTDLGFAKGICEKAALYFSPISVEDAAKKIIDITTNSSLRDTLIQEGFHRLHHFDNYETRTRKYLEIIEYETNNSRS